jgi:hypothetical protein
VEQVIDPGSPLDTLTKLIISLDARGQRLKALTDYYDGKHRLAFSSEKFRQAFGGMFAAFSDNWMPLVVDAVEERLNVEGFRHGSDPAADKDAWEIWQRNGLDAGSQLAHSASLTVGDSYAIVWGDANGEPKVTIESAQDVIVAFSPSNRRVRVAAVKRWKENGGTYATLFMADAVYKFFKGEEGYQKNNWIPAPATDESWPLDNPLGAVPVVPLINRPSLDSDFGISEFANVIPQQDAANKLLADMLVASEFTAFPQRYVTGLELKVDDKGSPIAPFQIAIDKLLQAEDPDAKFGTLPAGDLTNYIKPIELLVQHIASQTRTPPHYFYLSGNFPSGDAIKSAETGLVAKSRRKMRFYGESWEEVMRLCFAVTGDPRAEVMDAETIWGDPEYRSESELADALVKRAAIGVPRRQLWEDAGYSQTEISRFKEMEAEDALDSLLAPPAIPTVGKVPVIKAE